MTKLFVIQLVTRVALNFANTTMVSLVTNYYVVLLLLLNSYVHFIMILKPSFEKVACVQLVLYLFTWIIIFRPIYSGIAIPIHVYYIMNWLNSVIMAELLTELS